MIFSPLKVKENRGLPKFHQTTLEEYEVFTEYLPCKRHIITLSKDKKLPDPDLSVRNLQSTSQKITQICIFCVKYMNPPMLNPEMGRNSI